MNFDISNLSLSKTLSLKRQTFLTVSDFKKLNSSTKRSIPISIEEFEKKQETKEKENAKEKASIHLIEVKIPEISPHTLSSSSADLSTLKEILETLQMNEQLNSPKTNTSFKKNSINPQKITKSLSSFLNSKFTSLEVSLKKEIDLKRGESKFPTEHPILTSSFFKSNPKAPSSLSTGSIRTLSDFITHKDFEVLVKRIFSITLGTITQIIPSIESSVERVLSLLDVDCSPDKFGQILNIFCSTFFELAQAKVIGFPACSYSYAYFIVFLNRKSLELAKKLSEKGKEIFRKGNLEIGKVYFAYEYLMYFYSFKKELDFFDFLYETFLELKKDEKFEMICCFFEVFGFFLGENVFFKEKCERLKLLILELEKNIGERGERKGVRGAVFEKVRKVRERGFKEPAERFLKMKEKEKVGFQVITSEDYCE